ncbi:hypothetical protein JZU57_00460, partial [bacterium]|nr:hypothetical protein [bacterium]
DDNALHHLAAEIIDNAMDEAVAGHADRIEVTLEADGQKQGAQQQHSGALPHCCTIWVKD